jgi:hypothetical protein
MKEEAINHSSSAELDVPEQNVRGFSLMYRLENAVRELLVEELSKHLGARWYKHRLPGDILKKYVEAIQSQRTISWSALIPHHPIYYVDFPDLKKIIERQDNWEECFSKLFSRKDLISATLSELEPIRNSLAHNRKISREDLTLLEASFVKLVSAIGAERFKYLASQISTASTIREELEKLLQELEVSAAASTKFQALRDMHNWLNVKKQWWFDETYLGGPTEPIENCFGLLTEYASLPRHRGCGHMIESWLRGSGLSEATNRASEVLRNFIESSRSKLDA